MTRIEALASAKTDRLTCDEAKNGPSAADVVNETEEKILADIIFKYGEERLAHRIARTADSARANRPLTRTGELANIVRDIYRGRPHKN